MKSLIAFVALFVLVSAAAPPKWERLGVRKVNYGLDHDVIPVGAHEGGFKKLKVVVNASPLNMHKMVVHFGNGTQENIDLKHNFTKASASRVIDLPGEKRIIKSIEFWYDTKNFAKGKATVRVFGMH